MAKAYRREMIMSDKWSLFWRGVPLVFLFMSILADAPLSLIFLILAFGMCPLLILPSKAQLEEDMRLVDEARQVREKKQEDERFEKELRKKERDRIESLERSRKQSLERSRKQRLEGLRYQFNQTCETLLSENPAIQADMPFSRVPFEKHFSVVEKLLGPAEMDSTALDKFVDRAVFLALIEKHKKVLIAKFAELLEFDDYDAIKTDNRKDEALYFVQRVVEPHFKSFAEHDQMVAELLDIFSIERVWSIKRGSGEGAKTQEFAPERDDRQKFGFDDDFIEEAPDDDWSSDLYEADLLARGDL